MRLVPIAKVQTAQVSLPDLGTWPLQRPIRKRMKNTFRTVLSSSLEARSKELISNLRDNTASVCVKYQQPELSF